MMRDDRSDAVAASAAAGDVVPPRTQNSRWKQQRQDKRQQQTENRVRARKQRTRRIGIILGVLGLLTLVGIGVAVYTYPVITVSEVRVVGNTNATAEDIALASGIQPGDNLLRVDSEKAAAGVAEVPWIEKVTISRSWPRAMTIEVAEHVAAAYIKDRSETYVIDTKGKLFLAGVQPPGTVRLAQIDPKDADLIADVMTAVVSLPPEARGRIDRVEAQSREKITLFFADGWRIYWGSPDRSEEKAEATRIILTREPGQWNVSNPAMPSVRR